MKVRFWGVRGSFAMCGKDFLRHGGNTTSVELVTDGGSRLLIDLGTGATVYAKHLMASEFGRGEGQLPVLLSHTHLDHIQGLPFFTPFFIKGNQIRILGADPAGSSLKGTLQNQLAPHYSPLNGLENLAAGVSIESFLPGAEFAIGDFEITTAALPHGTMWTTGFRIKADDKIVAFLSDVEYPAPHRPTREAFALAAGADLLIHDAMHDDDAYAMARGWGHSPVSAGVHLARAAGAAKLALFHHSPDATDAAIDRLVVTAAARASVPVFAAAEGAYLDVMRHAVLLLAALTAGACARRLPPDRSAAALYRDLERLVTVAETTGWDIDRKEVEGLESEALDSLCRVDPLARRNLREWLDAETAAAGGPVEAAWRARGKRLGAIETLLRLHRIGLVLDDAERIAAVDCPFWLEPEEPFRGRQISDGRWQLHASGGGKGMVVQQGDRRDLSGGGAGRLLLGKSVGPRSALYAGVELGATAAFPKDALGNRTGLVLGVDVVTPVVYRYTLTNAYVEGELGWLGRTTEDRLDQLDQGVHVGASVGGRALRTRFFFPGAAFGVSWERAFVDGADLTTIKVGARVGVDIDLW